MPFNNPILAGEELIRSAIRSEDFVTDVSGWRISRDGSAEFNSLSIRDTIAAPDIILSGESVRTSLGHKSNGLISYHARTTSSTTVNNGVEQPVIKLNYTAPAGRMVKYELVGGLYTNGANPAHFSVYIRYTSDGSEPTLSSPVIRQTGVFVPGGGLVTGFKLSFYQFEPNGLNMKTLVSFIQNNPGGQTNAMFGLSTWPIEVSVTDIGDAFPSNGADYDGGSGTAPTFRSFDIQPYASRSYTGSGTHLPYDNQYMMQGDIGIDGNRRSWMWFDANSTSGGNGLGSLNDMQGASSVDYFEVYLYYPHWYFSTGGNCWIGHHNVVTVSNTEQSGVAKEVLDFWPGRNIGKWVNLKGSSIETAAIAGTIEGLILGNTGSSSRTDYGYAFGANGVLGQCPGLRAGYWK